MRSAADSAEEESHPLAASQIRDDRSGERRRAGPRLWPWVSLLITALAAIAMILALVASAHRLPGAAFRSEGAAVAEVVLAEDSSASSSRPVFEWEVVWPTGVHVRSGRSIYTTALGVKAANTHVLGRQDGTWVALEGTKGYILIQNGAHQLLRRGKQVSGGLTSTTSTVTQAPTTTASPTLPSVTLGDCKPMPSQFEWQVVGANVYVRMEANAGSLVLATRKAGDTLVGSKEGDWLRLWHNRGFVAFMEGGKVALKDNAAQYCRVPHHGSCAVVGRSPILDAAVCEAAAATLGVPNNQVHLTNLAPFKEGGCFLKPGGGLMFGTQGNPNGDTSGSELLCSGQATAPLSPSTKPTTEAPTTSTTAPTTSVGTTSAPTTTSTPIAVTTAATTAPNTSTTVAKTTVTTTKAPTTAAPTTTITSVTTTEPPTTTSSTEFLRPSLFCWVVAMAHQGPKQPDSEANLMRNAYRRGAGIFACNHWEVFTDEVFSLADDGPNTTGIPGPKSKMGTVPNFPSQFKMLLNTGVFFRAWDKVLYDKIYEPYDWTIKLDPDSVFFPDRMRIHLKQGNYNRDQPIFFNNCQRWSSMQGPLEAFSHAAMATFEARIGECKGAIDQKAIGEDIFMQKCTVQLNMQAIPDWAILRDQYCQHLDNPCADGYTVAFHPYKSVDMWNACHDTAVPPK